MMVGRDASPEKDQCWVAIAFTEITENLIVGSVFLNNVDDMFKKEGRLCGATENSSCFHRKRASNIPPKHRTKNHRNISVTCR
jgi:hypothetical protein